MKLSDLAIGDRVDWNRCGYLMRTAEREATFYGTWTASVLTTWSKEVESLGWRFVNAAFVVDD